MLPDSEANTIKKEPQNNTTRLLAAVIYLKLKRKFLNKGTQWETEDKFLVKSKQLSKLMSRKKYLGGKDKKFGVKRKRTSLKSSTAVKDPETNDDTDD